MRLWSASGQSLQFFLAQYEWTFILFLIKSPMMYNIKKNSISLTFINQLWEPSYTFVPHTTLCELGELLCYIHCAYNQSFNSNVQQETSQNPYHAMYQRNSAASSLAWCIEQLEAVCRAQPQLRSVLRRVSKHSKLFISSASCKLTPCYYFGNNSFCALNFLRLGDAMITTRDGAQTKDLLRA